MSLHREELPKEVIKLLRRGVVIPAHPLALTEHRNLDDRYQQALSRYYIAAGAGGLAVGVHATQFGIRDAGLYEPVLRMASETVADWTDETKIMIAGLVGSTKQALAEADVALGLGYHAGLLSLAAYKGSNEDEIIAHCRAVADRMPVIGFFLQPAVGGILLSSNFWRRFATIDNVIAIKVAPFNRYHTLDVIRGVVAAEAENRISLYTGNDDHILLDLLTPYALKRGDDEVLVGFKGGLLGHWSVWVKPAVNYLAHAHSAIAAGTIDMKLLQLDSQITDANGALFDVAHNFAGCISGCHEVLRRQGLMRGIWCLNPDEKLSPGQAAELDRVIDHYPHLCDDDFVTQNLELWLE